MGGRGTIMILMGRRVALPHAAASDGICWNIALTSGGGQTAKVRNVSNVGSQVLGPQACDLPTPAFSVDSAAHATADHR